MGSDEMVYENRIINHTFEPALTPIIFVLSIISLVGSILFYLYTKKKLQPEPVYKPAPQPSPQPKKVEPPKVKSNQDMTTQYSDDHLIVTSNMQERLKMFENKKIIK